MKIKKHKNVLANRFSALDIFWKRKEERVGSVGWMMKRQKEVFGLIRHPVWCVLALAHGACGQIWHSDMLTKRDG